MHTSYQRSEGPSTPASLRVSHDDVRARLVHAAMQGGEIADAARQLARVCLPHFEIEEEFAFPALGLLPDLIKGMVRPEMAAVVPLISDFCARHAALDEQHKAIQSATDALLAAAQREGNRDVAELAYSMRIHERVEDEVIYPMVQMIRTYLLERLAM